MIDIFDTAVIRAAIRGEVPASERTALAVAQGLSPQGLIDIVERAELTGKGGAGFPVARKLSLLQRQATRHRTLVVNGSEHEPGSRKDAYLLEMYSETVVEGALIMARAAGAQRVRIAINQGSVAAMAAMSEALESAARRNWTSDDSLTRDVAVVVVPDLYIVGEETALLEVLGGRRPLPTKRPPYPIECGLDGDATLVHNVETVAHLPFIVAHGDVAYRALGRKGHAATLCTFGPEFVNSGVQLVPLGIDIHDLVYLHGGGLRSGTAIKAVQPGGPSAGFLASTQFDVQFDGASLSAAGSALGCAVIRAFAQDDDMVAAVAEVMDFFAKASCGQCPSCRMETQMLASITKQILQGRGNALLVAKIPRLIGMSAGKGICGLIAMPAQPAISALRHFEHEFNRYLSGSEPILPTVEPSGYLS